MRLGTEGRRLVLGVVDDGDARVLGDAMGLARLGVCCRGEGSLDTAGDSTIAEEFRMVTRNL